MSFFDFLQQIREKPEAERKKILWATMGIVGFFIGIIWISSLKEIFTAVTSDPGEKVASETKVSSPFEMVYSKIGNIANLLSGEVMSVKNGGVETFSKEDKKGL